MAESWTYPYQNHRVRSLTLKELYYSSERDSLIYRAEVTFRSGECAT